MTDGIGIIIVHPTITGAAIVVVMVIVVIIPSRDESVANSR